MKVIRRIGSVVVAFSALAAPGPLFAEIIFNDLGAFEFCACRSGL